MKTFFRTTKTFILFSSLLSWGVLGMVHIPQENIEHFSQHLEEESRQGWEYLEGAREAARPGEYQHGSIFKKFKKIAGRDRHEEHRRIENRRDFLSILEDFVEILEEESKQEWNYLGNVEPFSYATLGLITDTFRVVKRILREDPSQERRFSRRLRELRMTVRPGGSSLKEGYLSKVMWELTTISCDILIETGDTLIEWAVKPHTFKDRGISCRIHLPWLLIL